MNYVIYNWELQSFQHVKAFFSESRVRSPEISLPGDLLISLPLMGSLNESLALGTFQPALTNHHKDVELIKIHPATAHIFPWFPMWYFSIVYLHKIYQFHHTAALYPPFKMLRPVVHTVAATSAKPRPWTPVESAELGLTNLIRER